MTASRLPISVAKCFGKRLGPPPGTPDTPCNTCAHCLLPVTGGPEQRYFTTYPRNEDGTCAHHMRLSELIGHQQEEMFS